MCPVERRLKKSPGKDFNQVALETSQVENAGHLCEESWGGFEAWIC